jgi:hypothetical protein
MPCAAAGLGPEVAARERPALASLAKKVRSRTMSSEEKPAKKSKAPAEKATGEKAPKAKAHSEKAPAEKAGAEKAAPEKEKEGAKAAPAKPRPPADPRLKLLKKFHGKFLPKGELRDRHKALMKRWDSGEDHGGVTADELKSLLEAWRASRAKPAKQHS